MEKCHGKHRLAIDFFVFYFVYLEEYKKEK